MLHELKNFINKRRYRFIFLKPSNSSKKINLHNFYKSSKVLPAESAQLTSLRRFPSNRKRQNLRQFFKILL